MELIMLINTTAERRHVACNSLEMAKEAWESHRDECWLGASDMRTGNGNVMDIHGNKVAEVMYNGKIVEA